MNFVNNIVYRAKIIENFNHQNFLTQQISYSKFLNSIEVNKKATKMNGVTKNDWKPIFYLISGRSLKN